MVCHFCSLMRGFVFSKTDEFGAFIPAHLQKFLVANCGFTSPSELKSVSERYGYFFPDLGSDFTICDSLENDLCALKSKSLSLCRWRIN